MDLRFRHPPVPALERSVHRSGPSRCPDASDRAAARTARCPAPPVRPEDRVRDRVPQSPSGSAAIRPARRVSLQGRSHRSPLAQRRLRLPHHLAQRFRIGGAIDHDHAVALRRPAPERNLCKLALHHDRGSAEHRRNRHRLEHRLMLGGIERRPCRELPLHPHVDAEDMPRRPDTEPRPADAIGAQDPGTEKCRHGRAEDDRHRQSIEEDREGDAAQPVSHCRSRTAVRSVGPDICDIRAAALRSAHWCAPRRPGFRHRRPARCRARASRAAHASRR
ncbi:hypothetical protein DdX_19891 [Ditylenchus destructor]|uniref:Uncharacterized protein n=1 Tax=Ditylenchus destructor TaxID=166010 RepID=A0AAD4QX19_9BILA|nr:hypothetical protein DdX_19891 [Ditylenchus destructor]